MKYDTRQRARSIVDIIHIGVEFAKFLHEYTHTHTHTYIHAHINKLLVCPFAIGTQLTKPICKWFSLIAILVGGHWHVEEHGPNKISDLIDFFFRHTDAFRSKWCCMLKQFAHFRQKCSWNRNYSKIESKYVLARDENNKNKKHVNDPTPNIGTHEILFHNYTHSITHTVKLLLY